MLSTISAPRDPTLDSTLALVREGYEFIWSRCQRLDSDVFVTRIFGRDVVCMHGRDAAGVFYDPDRFERGGALPRRVVTSLFGKGAIQTLDGGSHRERKAAFLSLMTPSSMDALVQETARQWALAVRSWPSRGTVVLFDEAQRVLTSAACAWAGVPVDRGELPARARDLGRMVEGFGGVGPRLWRGKLARSRTERWIKPLVERVRGGALRAAPGSALHVMANLRTPGGTLVSAQTAAVELINVIRPIAAVAWYVAFSALALHEYPRAAARLPSASAAIGSSDYADQFMQEVRRFYPFTPYLGARVRAPFEWRGIRFEPGMLVLLDVYGTDHDPRAWDAPDEFVPERFARWSGGAFDLIPQGGGDLRTGHRCAGEWITMHQVTLALHVLTRWISYELVSEQDLGFDLRRMPTRPRSGVVLRDVRILPAIEAEPPHLPSQAAVRDAAAMGITDARVAKPAAALETELRPGPTA